MTRITRFPFSLGLVALLVATGTITKAQPNPTDVPVGTESVLGMTPTEYRQVQDAMVQVYEDPEVVALTKQIEQLLEQREKLILRKAKQRSPVHGKNIDKVEGELDRLRTLRRGGGSANPGKPGDPDGNGGG